MQACGSLAITMLQHGAGGRSTLCQIERLLCHQASRMGSCLDLSDEQVSCMSQWYGPHSPAQPQAA